MAIGHLIRASRHRARHVGPLEFGPGWGKTTLELAEFGARVTAVDISEPFRRADRRARPAPRVRRRRPSTPTCSTTGPATPYDRVLFFESFHHCRATRSASSTGCGRWSPPAAPSSPAGEPIVEDFPVPWGVRLDGLSVWSTRRFGWLELGFELAWFRALLESAGAGT